MANIIDLDYLFDTQDVDKSVSFILSYIRPSWKNDNIETKLMTAQGMMNKKWTCQEVDEPDDVIVFRVYEVNNVVDHEKEFEFLRLANDAGVCMPIYAKYKNGYAYKYADGDVMTADQVVDPHIYKLVINKMHQLHQVDVSSMKDDKSDVMRLVFDNCAQTFFTYESLDTDERYTDVYPPRTMLVKEKDFALNLHEELRNELPLVLCHSDTHTLNVIYNRESGTINFIDWDTITLSYEPLEIGTHWERDGVYGFEKYGIDIFNDDNLQRDWLTCYLQTHPDFLGKDIDDELVLKWQKWVHKSAYISSCVIMFWTLSQIYTVTTTFDFDFWKYADYMLKKTRRLKSLFTDEPVSGCEPWVDK